MHSLGEAEQHILEALIWLLERPQAERPFVIVQSLSNDDCFVQFATANVGALTGTLLLDLPSVNLDRKAMERAEAFLEVVESALRRPWSLRRGAPTYQALCASAAEAASLAMRVMREVHALAEDSDILIVRSWAS